MNMEVAMGAGFMGWGREEVAQMSEWTGWEGRGVKGGIKDG